MNMRMRVDAMALAKVAPVEAFAADYAESAARSHYDSAVKALGEIGPTDVVLAKVRNEDGTVSWRAMTRQNLNQGVCNCCLLDPFNVADVVEVRKVRISVEE